jgi:hypothetical protein
MHVVPLEATSTFPSAVARDRKVTIRLIPEIVQNPWTGGRYVVQIEQAMLVMEPEGAGAELLLEMKRYRSEWYQDVPGVLAGETGFKFHIEYRNGPFVAVDPPGAPGDSLYWIDVHPPAAMTTFVQSDDDFHIGKPIDVIVAMTPGAFFVRGNLYYRRAGVTSYGVTALRLDTVSQQPRATIFPSRVTGRGVEYWVEVETQARMLTDPVTNPAESPLPGGRYRLLSLPLDVGSNTSLETILADVDGLGRHGEGSWRAFVTRPMRGHLELTSRTQVDFRVAPGRSFWLISRRDHQLTTRAVVGRSTPSQPAFAIVLSPGWSAIGNPFLFDVAWESVRTSAAIDPPVGFDPSVGKRGDYVDTDPVVLKPFDGYLIENTSVGRETLWVPSIEFTDATNGTGVKSVTSMTSSAGSQDFEWTLQVRATSATAFDGANVVGVHPEAESGRDLLDRRKPPSPPGEWIRLTLPHPEWRTESGDYRRDVRPTGADGYIWNLELTSQHTEEPTVISVLGGRDLPQGLVLRLVDRELGVHVESTQEVLTHEVLAFGPDRPYGLSVLVGNADYVSRESSSLTGVPAGLVLDPARPNPFNAHTRIRFGIARPTARVELGIYDARGRLVATPLSPQPLAAGFHSVIWDGTDTRGEPVPSGIYFYRVSDGANEVARRLAWLK